MIKVFYKGYPQSKINAWLGGVLFSEGIAEFKDIEEGKKFAEMFHLSYEVVEIEKPKAKGKKVNK